MKFHDALYHILDQDPHILRIRRPGDVKAGKGEVVITLRQIHGETGQNLVLSLGDIADDWQLGWKCTTCEATGYVPIHDGEGEAECPDCDDGVRWSSTY